MLLGIGVAFYLVNKIVRGKSNNLIKEAEGEAEMIKQQKILQAKEKFLQLKEEHEKIINEKNDKLNLRENDRSAKGFSIVPSTVNSEPYPVLTAAETSDFFAFSPMARSASVASKSSQTST